MSAPPTLDYASAPPPDPIPLPRRLAAEFVGTFALVFAGCGAIAAGVEHVGVALAFGLTIMAMVIAVGDISGAHFNPAVSFAFAVSRRMRPTDAAAYVGAQCLAAIAAAAILWMLWGGLVNLGATVPVNTVILDPQSVVDSALPPKSAVAYLYFADPSLADYTRTICYEIILTFFLVFVILCVAIGSKERGLMAGIAIGGTVAFCALMGGPVSGASMNPARSLGPALVSGWEAMRHLWIYWTAPFIGSLIAVAAWSYIYRPAAPAPPGER